jgi:hypothetical protein
LLEWIINVIYIIFINVIQTIGEITVIETYAEYGAIGVIIMLFIGMIKFLQSSLTNKLSEIEGICIKLIDRWNRSDEQSNSENDRRHEQMLQAINRITDDLNYLKGRINNTPK